MGVSLGPSESDLSKPSCTRAPTTRQSTFPLAGVSSLPDAPAQWVKVFSKRRDLAGSQQDPSGIPELWIWGAEAGGPVAELGTGWFLPCHQLTPKSSFASFNPLSSWGGGQPLSSLLNEALRGGAAD